MMRFPVQVKMFSTLIAQYGLRAEEGPSGESVNIIYPGGMKFALMKDNNGYILTPINFGNYETLRGLSAKEVKVIMLKFLRKLKQEIFKDLLKGGSYGTGS